MAVRPHAEEHEVKPVGAGPKRGEARSNVAKRGQAQPDGMARGFAAPAAWADLGKPPAASMPSAAAVRRSRAS
jgi:hypothetical protein